MKNSFRKGFSFGLTSGIITTLGMIVGLHSSTHSPTLVIGGILMIAVADALSDALGIHISEEAEIQHSPKEIWEATLTAFLSKFVFALTFVLPILLLPLSTAIIVSVIWGFSLITLFSVHLAKQQNIKSYKVVLEHVLIAVVVVVATHYLGTWVATFG
ncbi:MAG TPA: hypothetical protein HA348_00610 [Thermoplasmata archaeon]|nr:hypothetical protein [Thermoplasmata archaeon]